MQAFFKGNQKLIEYNIQRVRQNHLILYSDVCQNVFFLSLHLPLFVVVYVSIFKGADIFEFCIKEDFHKFIINRC